MRVCGWLWLYRSWYQHLCKMAHGMATHTHTQHDHMTTRMQQDRLEELKLKGTPPPMAWLNGQKLLPWAVLVKNCL